MTPDALPTGMGPTTPASRNAFLKAFRNEIESVKAVLQFESLLDVNTHLYGSAYRPWIEKEFMGLKWLVSDVVPPGKIYILNTENIRWNGDLPD